MLKVPGEEYSLAQIKGQGGRVGMVYSPFDVIDVAVKNPDETYVIASVGFETTAPVFALLLDELIRRDIHNIKLLTSLKSALPAIEWVCENEKAIDGFLCPGHVSVITGIGVFDEVAHKYGKPFVIAGFEEQHILKAVYEIVRDVEEARNCSDLSDDVSSCDGYTADCEPVSHRYRSKVKNLYKEAVAPEGNVKAKLITEKYFDIDSAVWRGLGEIPNSGYYIKDEYKGFDAGSHGLINDRTLPQGCRCSDVITGRLAPNECPMFGTSCTPVSPYGPCMVSAEGSCGIWYQNR
jgi:hydrogenase expression/formation protein HypD